MNGNAFGMSGCFELNSGYTQTHSSDTRVPHIPIEATSVCSASKSIRSYRSGRRDPWQPDLYKNKNAVEKKTQKCYIKELRTASGL